MTRMVKTLEAKAWLRETSSRDARVTVVSLTDANTVVQVRVALSSVIGEVLSELAPTETAMLEDLLAKALISIELTPKPFENTCALVTLGRNMREQLGDPNHGHHPNTWLRDMESSRRTGVHN